MEKKNQVLMTVLGVFALVLVTVGVSYAFFTYTRTGTTTSTINTTTGNITFLYTDDADGVTMTDAVPMTAAQGKALTNTYDFSIAGEMPTGAKLTYSLYAVDATDRTTDPTKAIAHSQVRAYLTDGTGNALWTGDGTKLMSDIITTGTEGNLYTDTVTTTTGNKVTKDFKLRIWLDSDNSSTSGIIDASDNEGNGVIQPGDNYTVTDEGEGVSSTQTGKTYSLKIKVKADAVSTQSE